MATSEQPIHFANARLGAERHICAFFHSSDEEYRVLLPFIREGIERGEKAFTSSILAPWRIISADCERQESTLKPQVSGDSWS